MKTVIVYESTHHKNTYKLIEAITDKFDVDTVDVKEAAAVDLSEYDLIGFASGIAFGKFYPDIMAYAKNNLPENKKVFLLYTCGKDSKNYPNAMKALATEKGCDVLGCYGSLGYDTFGPFKLIGGISKNHPTASEISGAVDFFGKLSVY